jgi:hypothetical protein
VRGPAAVWRLHDHFLSNIVCKNGVERDLNDRQPQYGDEQFGIAQSDRYREKLKKRFSVLADTPDVGQA